VGGGRPAGRVRACAGVSLRTWNCPRTASTATVCVARGSRSMCARALTTCERSLLPVAAFSRPCPAPFAVTVLSQSLPSQSLPSRSLPSLVSSLPSPVPAMVLPSSLTLAPSPGPFPCCTTAVYDSSLTRCPSTTVLSRGWVGAGLRLLLSCCSRVVRGPAWRGQAERGDQVADPPLQLSHH